MWLYRIQWLNKIQVFQMGVCMIFTPATCPYAWSEYDSWEYVWALVKNLANLRVIEFCIASSQPLVQRRQNIMDLESIAPANRKLQFYLVISSYQFWGVDPGGLPDSVDFTAVRHLVPSNAHTIQAALAELKHVNIS